MSFSEFWVRTGRQGKVGPASAEWRRLKPSEQRELSDLIIACGGTLDIGMWASVFLRDRLWRQFTFAAPVSKSPARGGDRSFLEMVNGRHGAPTTRRVMALPHSQEWWFALMKFDSEHRTRDIELMKWWANQGKSYEVELPVDLTPDDENLWVCAGASAEATSKQRGVSWPRFLWTPHCPLEPRRNGPHEGQFS
jgi:hypothetical protein